MVHHLREREGPAASGANCFCRSVDTIGHWHDLLQVEPKRKQRYHGLAQSDCQTGEGMGGGWSPLYSSAALLAFSGAFPGSGRRFLALSLYLLFLLRRFRSHHFIGLLDSSLQFIGRQGVEAVEHDPVITAD